jgi:thiamine-phosphate pyrophosphorylase
VSYLVESEEPPLPRLPAKYDLYVITNSRLGGGRSVIEQAAAAIAGGADVIQLREPEMPTADLVELGRAMRALTRRTGTTFVMNDRVDVALVVDADGVHLGQDDMRPADARSLLGPDRIIGVSAGNPREYQLVLEQGADYIGVGPVYQTGSKGDAGTAIGPDGIATMRRLTDLPIVAIGGLSAENLSPVVSAGADGIAVISAVISQPDIAEAARVLKDALQRARRAGT